ncbi:hypothetical protein RVD_126 [viral metagenome]
MIILKYNSINNAEHISCLRGGMCISEYRAFSIESSSVGDTEDVLQQIPVEHQELDIREILEEPSTDVIDGSDRNLNSGQSTDSSVRTIPVLGDGLQNIGLINESGDISELAKKAFEVEIKTKNKYVVPDRDLSHFKDRSNAAMLSVSDDLFVRIKCSDELRSRYVRALAKLLLNNSYPVPQRFIRELHTLYLSKASNRERPLWYLQSLDENICGTVVYGLANGAADFHHFIQSPYRSMSFRVKYDASKSLTYDTSITFTKHDGSCMNVTSIGDGMFFDPTKVDLDPHKFKSVMSMCSRSNNYKLLSEMYSISGIVNVGFSQEAEAVRRALVNSAGKDDVISGFLVRLVVNGAPVKVNIADTYIVEQLTPYFISDSFDDEGLHECMQYTTTVLAEYLRKQIHMASGVAINELDIELDLERNHVEVKNSFVSMVDDGVLMPVTLPHYVFYLNDDYDIDEWRAISFETAVSNARMYGDLIPLIPKVEETSRMLFRMMAKNRNMLSDKYYLPNVPLPFQLDQRFEISFRDLISELMVRSLSGNMPDYMYPISQGEWVNGGISSHNIILPMVRGYINKYSVSDEYTSVYTLIKDLLIEDDFIAYVKKTTRLVRELPPVFDIYVASE